MYEMHSTGRNPWDVLGLPEGAPFRDVKTAFQRKVKRAHPDVEGGSSEAFRELLAAYESLSRDIRPEERPSGPTPGPAPAAGPGPASRPIPTPAPGPRRATRYDAWIAEEPTVRRWDEPRDPVWAAATRPGGRRPADFISVLRDEIARADRVPAAADPARRRPATGPMVVRPVEGAGSGRGLGGLLRRRARRAA
jgi:hypothetical protein